MNMGTEHRKDLSTLHYLDGRYADAPRRHRSDGVDRGSHLAWKEGFRQDLSHLLGIHRRVRCDLEVSILGREEVEGHTRYRVEYRSEPDATVTAYLLVPDDTNGSALVALHGHGAGKNDVVGLYDTEGEKAELEGYNYAYATECASRGYLVLAPDQRSFGERSHGECRKAQLNALLIGDTLIGLRVWDCMRAVDVLEHMASTPDLPGYVYDRVGVIGLSGGGTISLHTAALDDRLSFCCISGYLASFKESIFDLEHCECNYTPGILELGEMYDIASLIAPRPLFVETGDLDDIYPVGPAREAFSRVQKVYEMLGVPERAIHEVFTGRHRWNGQGVYGHLERWKGGEFHGI